MKRIRNLARKVMRIPRLLLWNITRKLRTSVTVRTKQGTFTISCQDNAISKALYCTGEFEMDLMVKAAALLQKLEPAFSKGTILDIGANIGVISVGMLHAGLMTKAIAIEPEPYNFSLLQHNVRQNGLEDKVICLPYAAADKSGKISFELSATNFGDHRVHFKAPASGNLYQESGRHVIEVEAEPIDDLLKKAPKVFTDEIGLIWIDVQGYEGYVLLGGKSLFARDIPVVAEIWPYGIRRAGMSREQFCNIAKDIWSSYWILREGVQYPISELDSLFDELGYEGRHTNILFANY